MYQEVVYPDASKDQCVIAEVLPFQNCGLDILHYYQIAILSKFC